MSFLVLMGLAIAPGISLAIYVYFRDKFDKEPLLTLVISFFLGILSTIPIFFSEILVSKIPLIKESVFSMTFLGVALIEEFWKMFL